jgi:acyl-CoA hydrolase
VAVRIPQAAGAGVDLGAVLRAGDRIAVAQGAAEPLGLVLDLQAQADELPPIELFSGLSLSGLFTLELARAVRMRSYGAMGALAKVFRAGLLDVVPCHYSDLPRLVQPGEPLEPDVVFAQVAPVDGGYSLGLGMDYVADCIEHARCVVAEINDQLPIPRGALRIPASRLDVAVEISRPLIEMTSPPSTTTDEAIGRNVAALIPNESTIQLGFGSTVNAIGRQLCDRRGLRVHSALVGDWLLDLSEGGALASKPDEYGSVVVTGAALGAAALYEFVGRSELVEFRRIGEVQRPDVLMRRRGLRAVNSAIEVDLAGQTNVEIAGGRRIAALGGHTDFLRGAQAAEDGLGIVALPATAAESSRSRIVSRLDSGWISTPQSCVDVVVTEHGAATIRGTSLGERSAALTAIAAPEFRADLSAPPSPFDAGGSTVTAPLSTAKDLR